MITKQTCRPNTNILNNTSRRSFRGTRSESLVASRSKMKLRQSTWTAMSSSAQKRTHACEGRSTSSEWSDCLTIAQFDPCQPSTGHVPGICDSVPRQGNFGHGGNHGLAKGCWRSWPRLRFDVYLLMGRHHRGRTPGEDAKLRNLRTCSDNRRINSVADSPSPRSWAYQWWCGPG